MTNHLTYPSRTHFSPIQGNQQRIYTSVKDRIIACKMLPGETIYEDRLAQEFGTSRTPVREALLKLCNDNLVSIIPRKGTFVSHITVQSVYEIYQVRHLIEPGVAAMVRTDVTQEKLQEFSRRFEKLKSKDDTIPDWFAVDREFHTYLVECTHNHTLMAMFEGIMNHQQRISILASKLPHRLEDTAVEHQAIIDALLVQDPEKIKRTVTDHIKAAWDASLKIERLVR